MTRLTRAEQQQRTHEQLLSAGRKVFLERGFLMATVEEIAAKGGYTRGAVYKHFGGKEGLWLTLIETNAAAQIQALRDAMTRAKNRDDLLAALTPSSDDAMNWSLTTAEVLAATRQQPEIATRISVIQQNFDDQIIALLDEHTRRLHLELALPLSQAVMLLGALNIGLALRQTIAPASASAAVLAHALSAAFSPPTSTS